MPSLQEETVGIEELATALHIDPPRLKRTWRRMHERKGFPPPLPGGNWVWGRRAVLRWIGGPTPAPGANDNAGAAPVVHGVDSVVHAQHEHLSARYGRGNP